MKTTIFLAILAAAITNVSAADFAALPDFRSFERQAVAVAPSAPALVSLDAANKADDNTKGYLTFINWGLYQPTKMAAIVIYGPVARNLYDTMSRAKYRPAPANLASMHPREVSRNICEARLGKFIVCLKIPKMMADGSALVLTNGKPTYTDDSYQCDVNIIDSQTMEFGQAN